MAEYDLTTHEGIRQAHESEFLPLENREGWKAWLAKYVQMIELVRKSSVDELASPQIQNELWESTAISGSGMCSIPMADAIQSQELRQWVASLKGRELPPAGQARIDALKEVHSELQDRTKPFTKRRPWLKFMRLLAAFFPQDISCLVDYDRLRILANAMLGKIPHGQADMVTMNAGIFQKVDESIGPPQEDAASLAKRSMFAWELYRITTEKDQEEAGEVEGNRPGEATLKFLPDDRRTKGISALSGYVNTALKILDFVQNGATISETVKYYQEEFPQLKENSVKQHLGTIRHNLGLLRLDGTTLKPSALGQKLLDTEDPTILIPRVLTRVIGFDLILYLLKEESPRPRAEVMEALRKHWTWTSNFGPSGLLQWAIQLRMVQQTESQEYVLTEVGQEWAEQIPSRPRPVAGEVEITGIGDDPVENKEFIAPSLQEILDYFDQRPYVFPRQILAKLHVALHMHPSKHFVLLSGLSGTGKTQLAKVYADAYHRVNDSNRNPYFCLVPVQPDWTDSAGLLGYVNPLQETVTYAATEFLTFLRSAVNSPHIPHFACLDEMNLARVEYYFAPLLSAMETAQDLVIHQNDEAIDTIEPSLPWPSNLFIIGTVNMDETTHAFSDKVLDRAFTLEFWDVDLERFRERFSMSHPTFPAELLSYGIENLQKLQGILEPAHQHFGYRTAQEVLNFLGTNEIQGAGVMPRDVALDQAVLMKILPKLRGQDSPEFRQCLPELDNYLSSQGFAQSARKIKAMKEELERTGTTRFWR